MIILKKDKVLKNQFVRIDSEKFSIANIKNYSIISKKQWLMHKKLIIEKRIIVSVEFFSDEIFDFDKQDLNKISMIVINFKTFKDGTPFTMAKKIRREFQYKKEIRASGYILPDQYIFLLRCGFDSVEIKSKDKNEWIESYEMDCGLYYQQT